VTKTGNEYRVQPKAGKWSRPFILIPSDEQEKVKPVFGGSPFMIQESSESEFVVDGKKYFGMVIGLLIPNGGIPASKDVYYSITYENPPSSFVFGDWDKTVIVAKPK
jgi:hypothetical protein